MAAMTNILPAVSIHAPEVPQVVMEAVYVEVAREFCRMTRAAQSDLTPVALVADTSTYTLTPPANTEIIDIATAKIAGKEPLRPMTRRQIQDYDPQWETRTGDPVAYILTGTSLRLWPTPSADASLNLRVVVMPNYGVSDIPNVLVQHYEVALRHGALARVLGMPRKPWTDKVESRYHSALFEYEVALATSKVAAEQLSGVIRETRYGGP